MPTYPYAYAKIKRSIYDIQFPGNVMVSYAALVMRYGNFRRSDLAAAYALAGVSDPSSDVLTPEKSTTVKVLFTVFLINQFSLRFWLLSFASIRDILRLIIRDLFIGYYL